MQDVFKDRQTIMLADAAGQEQTLIVAAQAEIAAEDGDGNDTIKLGHIQVVIPNELEHELREDPAQDGLVVIFILVQQRLKRRVELQRGPGKIKMDLLCSAITAQISGGMKMARAFGAERRHVLLQSSDT